MSETRDGPTLAEDPAEADGTDQAQRQKALLQVGALQHAIVTSPNFAIIATDEKGIMT